ncbi:uncharacterized protein LOC129717024 [Wyeomyia smithii]|uniref:uncharacterized protein LOC129717024 n=1 Tax=Wyeomyia smithii TaxID=174621 RepID=UPI002467E8FB|nr:uncharacterized protein LOC129717024 [Wyeomyia smithii]
MSLAEIPAPKGAVYLPHHCVLKETSLNTKRRVVFDASSKTASSKSLNDVLMTGPVLQDSLVNILLRFRTPAIALTGDVRQMYRMVKVAAADCNYQRILWRWNEKDPVDEYTLNTVIYGTKSASYLATKCVRQLLSNLAESDPDTFQKASMGIYVDDILTGADSPEEARRLRQKLSEIFSTGGFHLREWASNHSSALEGVPEADLEVKIPIELHGSDTIKALGIHWQPCSDEFTFSYQPSKSFQPTKRIILSQIASLFDPLGLLGPIIVMAKLVMRKLWELKVDWDTTPPGELINDWLIFAQNLSSLNSFQVPRRVIDARKPVKLYLHGYSDVSEKAMGACIYVRSVDAAGNHSSHLLCAKSKTAPIGNNRSTIPRLKLHAAVILARLIHNIADGASKWKTYVANRVADISTLLPAINWYHVRTQNNPADLISRGALPANLQGNSLWWHGSDWEHSSPSYEVDSTHKNHIDRERKSVAVSLLTINENSFIYGMLNHYYPNKQMLLRVTARLLRFAHRGHEGLSAAELNKALMIYVRHTQHKYFSNDIQRLKDGKTVATGSSMYQLYPHLDADGLLRMGGRLRLSKLNYNTKHQLLLPRHSILTSLILQHINNLHCGPQTLLAVSRQRFWIPYGTSAARKIYRQCITCARVRPPPSRQQMRQLPADRLEPQPPFAIVGIDYAGPINITSRKSRGTNASKGYIALFVCFVTKAVALEAVATCMNSRPIAPIANNPSDPQPLTPAHFLIGRPLTTAPEVNQLERRITSMTRWQFVQLKAQEFRDRWQREYVRSLQLFTKWQQSANKMKVGDFVLIVGENERPKQWPLERIVQTHPGPDGLVRVVTVKTYHGVTQRDIRRLRVVPLDSDEVVPGRLGNEIL